MMRSVRYSILFLLICAVSLTACNPIQRAQKRERLSQLDTTTNTYRKLMRWGHFDQAAQYLKARDDSQTAPNLKDMARYKVTQFTVADQIVSDTQVDAKVSAVIEFYNVETGVATTLTDSQLWWYDKEAKRWYLGSPMVNFADYE